MTVGDKVIQTKACTTCGAAVGERCKDAGGRSMGFLHIARTAAAQSDLYRAAMLAKRKK